MQGTPWGDDALDTLEAAEYLGLARSTIWQRYKEWNIPHIRVGGSLVFLKPELDKWKATHDTPHIGRGYYPRSRSDAA